MTPNQALRRLPVEMRACRRCQEAGYAVAPGAVFSGPASAQVMLIDQAPGVTEAQVKKRGPFAPNNT